MNSHSLTHGISTADEKFVSRREAIMGDGGGMLFIWFATSDHDGKISLRVA